MTGLGTQLEAATGWEHRLRPETARVLARADANARGLLHTEPTKLATIANEVIQMKTWKMKMPQRKTDYKTLKQAAEAIGGGD